MPVSFDLVEQGWIPCSMREGGVRELGLRETLARAPDVREIVDQSPLITASLHRLLLAILHRNLGPESVDKWRSIWEAERFDEGKLATYFGKWSDRFDLFHPVYPFYQTAGLEPEYAKPIAKLTHELASEANSNLLFDHTVEAVLSPAQAARYLVAYQSYSVGGWLSLRKGEPPGQYKSADAAPLSRGALTIVKGETLFRTLVLNLHDYSRASSRPMPMESDDCLTWELDVPVDAVDRWPRGYLEILTWQSRRVRLFPEESQEGVVVRSADLMKGFQFPDGFKESRPTYETMLAFRKIAKPQPGSPPWAEIGFRPDRALWRESQSMFQSIAEQSARPRIVGWLAELADAGAVDRGQTLSLDLLGMSTDRANVLLWRHERLPMPLRYLDEGAGRDLIKTLSGSLALAERASVSLRSSVWDLATLVISPNADRPGASQPRREAVTAMTERLGPTRQYWSRLEVPFRKLLIELPDDTTDGFSFGTKTIPEWAATVRRSARSAFDEAKDGLEATPRTLPAVAKAENRFERRLAISIRKSLREMGVETRSSSTQEPGRKETD